MRFLLFVVLSSVFLVAHAAADSATTTRLHWHLSLAADGTIQSLQPTDPDFLPDVRKQIEPIVRTWHFTPGKLDGKPAPTETLLSVTVAFEPEGADAQQYRVRITGARTGGSSKHRVGLRYPSAAQKAKAEGEVVLWVNYDGEGVVTSVKFMPDMSSDHVSRTLIDAATDTVKQWTFRPETVGGRGVSSEAIAPFCFKIAQVPCHFKPRPGVNDMQSGEAVALSSVVGVDTGDTAHLP